jgi:anti-anti-sigma factor
MSFKSTLEVANGIAQITLLGELDAAATPQFRVQVEQAAQAPLRRLVLIMQDLTYMSSAGLRELVFAKQKMGTGIDIYLIGVQESVLETIKMTGFQHSVILLDAYDAIEIGRP